MQENCHDAGHMVILAMTCFCRAGDMQPGVHPASRAPYGAQHDGRAGSIPAPGIL